jgi:hypothetical protein
LAAHLVNFLANAGLQQAQPNGIQKVTTANEWVTFCGQAQTPEQVDV